MLWRKNTKIPTSPRLYDTADCSVRAVVKRFYFLSFIPGYSEICLLYFLLAYYWLAYTHSVVGARLVTVAGVGRRRL